MLVLFSMLSGACACSVAVVKSLNMGNRTDTHTHFHTRRGVSVVFDLQYSAGHDVCLVTSRFCHSLYSTLFMKGYFSWAAWPGARQGFRRCSHRHTPTRTHTKKQTMHMHLGDQPYLNKVTCINRSLQLRPAHKHIHTPLMPNSSF